MHYKNFEDLVLSDNNSEINRKNKILRFSEYRRGSNEYGQIIHDLMLILRLKKDKDKESDKIILNKNDIKSLEYSKLLKLLSDKKTMMKLGMSFDVNILNNGNIEFYNLGNKENTWENLIN